MGTIFTLSLLFFSSPRSSPHCVLSAQRATLTEQSLQQRLATAEEASHAAQETASRATRELDDIRFKQASELATAVAHSRAEAHEQTRLADAARSRLEAMEAEVRAPLLCHDCRLSPCAACAFFSHLHHPFFPFSSFYIFDRRLSHSPRSAMKRSARTQISPWSAMRLPVSAVAQRTAPHP